MKKVVCILLIVLLLAGLSACQQPDGPDVPDTPADSPLEKEIKSTLDNYINSLMANTPSYVPYWNKESYKGRWNYIDGVFLNSIVNLYKQTGQSKYKDFFLKYINYYVNDSGEFVNPETLQPNFKAGELDSICASRVLFDAYEMTKDNKYLLAIENTYQYLVQIPKAKNSPNFFHKETYPNQVWLDGMYMYVPFYLRYANYKGLTDVYAEVQAQYKYIRDHMFSAQKQLYYHGHDTTKSIFWADDTTGNSQSFWLRSMGWYIVSLADSIEYVNDDAVKTYLKTLLAEALDGVLQYRDEQSKMFYQLVDKGATKFLVEAKYLDGLKNKSYMFDGKYQSTYIENYLESSGSAMIAYALLKSARLGYINKDLHQKGVECFEGIYNHSVSVENGVHLNNICITAGLGPENKPYRDGTPAYYLAEPVGSDDAKGVGPFIMAYLEYIS